MISLKQLRYFSAVARHGHFGRAAEFCNVTQPALSMQIRELEKELNIELFERRQQGVQLTEVGQEIFDRAQSVLNAVRDLNDFAHHHNQLLSGTLRFGVIPSIAPYILPPLLPKLRDLYPGLDLRIRETLTETLVDELIDGQLDLLLLALPIEHAEVETIALFEDRFLLASPAGWQPDSPRSSSRAKSKRKRTELRASPELLEDGRLLLLEEGHCLRDQALAFCQLRQVDNLDTFGASSLSTIVQMVANGMGLTLLPEMSVAVEARHGDVQVIPFEAPEPSRTIGLAWRKSSPLKPDFQAIGA
ncbi:MAG: hydrogen peroxide-inducible genes activator, partial [Pseudomonadota bacterium]